MGKPVKFEGISEELHVRNFGCFHGRSGVQARRRAREAFKDIKLSIDYILSRKNMLLSWHSEMRRRDNWPRAYNVVFYDHKPRLRTALQFLRTTQEMAQQLDKISLPLLILHGEDDKVTDPSVSKALYEKASSSDKTLNLYEGGCHCLLQGEPDDVVLRVFGDILSWLDHHC